MNRNLKVLGSILLAAFALSVVAAPGAHATEGTFSWESGTSRLLFEADPTDPSQSFHVSFAGITASFTCDEVSGEVTELTGTGALSVTVQNIHYADAATTPEVDKCTGHIEPGNLTPKETVNFNGCDYHFVAGQTEAEAPNAETEGTLEIKCPEGKLIEKTEAGCKVTIGAQTVGPIYFRTTHTTGKPEEITAEARIGDEPLALHNNALNYNASGLTCGTHSGQTNGTYTGKFTIKGFSASCTQTNATVT